MAGLALLLAAEGCTAIKLTDQVYDGSLPLKIVKPVATEAGVAAFLAQPMAAEFHTQRNTPGKVITVAQFLQAWSDPKSPKVATFLKFFLDNEENFRNACSRPGICTTDQTEAVDSFFVNLKVIQSLNVPAK